MVVTRSGRTREENKKSTAANKGKKNDVSEVFLNDR